MKKKEESKEMETMSIEETIAEFVQIIKENPGCTITYSRDKKPRAKPLKSK